MTSIPKHPQHDNRHGRHATDLSAHAEWLGFSIDNMDSSADPRRDFYRFAAGSWLDKTDIPDTDAQVSGFMGLFHRVNEQTLTLMQAAAAQSQHEPKGSVAQQVGDLYASAINTEYLDTLGFAPIQPVLDRIDHIANRADFATLIAILERTTDNGALLAAAVGPDKRRSDLNILQVFPCPLSLPSREFYLDDRFAALLTAYTAHVTDMLHLAGINRESAENQAKTVLDIESALANAMLSPLQATDPEARYHLMSLGELKGLAPYFDFETFFEQLGLTTIQADINIAEPAYLTAFNGLLAAHPLEELRSYLRWRLIHGMSQYLSPAAAEMDLDFYMKTLQGQTKLLPRSSRVASQIKHSLGHPVAQLYVRQYVTTETRQR